MVHSIEQTSSVFFTSFMKQKIDDMNEFFKAKIIEHKVGRDCFNLVKDVAFFTNSKLQQRQIF